MDLYKPKNIKAVIVVLGYECAAEEFRAAIKKQSWNHKFNLEEEEPILEIDGDIQNKEAVLADLKKSFPIIRLFNKEKTFEVTLFSNENKIQIVNSNFDPSSSKEFELMLRELLVWKILDIKTIGINFLADFELGDKKLKLLNDDIIGIKGWENNLTFQLILPIEYSDYVATYRIQKLLNPKEMTTPNRVYQIDVNFNIEESKMAFGDEKVNSVVKIIKELNTRFYDEFYNKCTEFLKLKYD